MSFLRWATIDAFRMTFVSRDSLKPPFPSSRYYLRSKTIGPFLRTFFLFASNRQIRHRRLILIATGYPRHYSESTAWTWQNSSSPFSSVPFIFSFLLFLSHFRSIFLLDTLIDTLTASLHLLASPFFYLSEKEERWRWVILLVVPSWQTTL